MTDQGGEGFVTDTDSSGDRSDSAPANDEISGLKSALDKERKERRDAARSARDEKKARKELEARLSELQAKVGQLTGTDDAKTPEPVVVDTSNAERAVARAAFKAEAIAQGIDPVLAGDAAKLADLSGVDVDLEQGNADGITDAVEQFKASRPQFFQSGQQDRAASTVTRPAGKQRGMTFDPTNATREQVKEFREKNPDGWQEYIDSNPKVSIAGPGGRMLTSRVTAKAGGELMDRINQARERRFGKQ